MSGGNAHAARANLLGVATVPDCQGRLQEALHLAREFRGRARGYLLHFPAAAQQVGQASLARGLGKPTVGSPAVRADQARIVLPQHRRGLRKAPGPARSDRPFDPPSRRPTTTRIDPQYASRSHPDRPPTTRARSPPTSHNWARRPSPSVGVSPCAEALPEPSPEKRSASPARRLAAEAHPFPEAALCKLACLKGIYPFSPNPSRGTKFPHHGTRTRDGKQILSRFCLPSAAGRTILALSTFRPRASFSSSLLSSGERAIETATFIFSPGGIPHQKR